MKKNGPDHITDITLAPQTKKKKKKSQPKQPIKFDEVPLFDRPREKMMKKGPKALSNLELVAAVLGIGSSGKDVYELAWEIVKLAEKNFNNLSIDKLKNIDGVGTAKACQIMAAVEFSRRFLLRDPIIISSDKDVIPLVAEIAGRKQEFFLTLSIDGANNLIEKRTVAIGTVNQSLIHPREIFADAVNDRAVGIILVHNHPSGNHSPSVEDYKVTDRMVTAGKLMGIRVMDHIIISKNGYYSFEKNGYIRKE